MNFVGIFNKIYFNFFCNLVIFLDSFFEPNRSTFFHIWSIRKMGPNQISTIKTRTVKTGVKIDSKIGVELLLF